MTMVVKEASAARPSARERLLAAANELFYNEGVHTVGIDRIIEQAGVAKASLYNTFGSQDELVRAYLETRDASVAQRITRAVDRYDTPCERLLAVFEELRESSQLIVITHQRRTMEAADSLYGVSMGGDGTSKVVSRRLGSDGIGEVEADAA